MGADNDMIKEYLAKRQQMFEEQKQAKRRWEGNDLHDIVSIMVISFSTNAVTP